MPQYNKSYEEQIVSFLYHVKERPGVYLGSPSLDKLLHVLVGYEVAFRDLMGYRAQFERLFRTHLRKKHSMECASLYQILTQGRSDREAFYAFFEELDLFCLP